MQCLADRDTENAELGFVGANSISLWGEIRIEETVIEGVAQFVRIVLL